MIWGFTGCAFYSGLLSVGCGERLLTLMQFLKNAANQQKDTIAIIILVYYFFDVAVEANCRLTVYTPKTINKIITSVEKEY